MSIHLTNLSKCYGRQDVLHGVSFTIQRGETVGFLGPNGAGKSTCMKIMTGWLAADSGNIEICGHNILTEPLEAKRRMGYLPENNPLYPEMYVREYLGYVGHLYRLENIRGRVNEMAERLSLTEVLGRTIGTLSKGYRQRVGLAQALLHNPDVLILDEPFSGLDPNQLSQIYSLVRELGKEKAILFSSHTLSEASELCRRTIIINQGRIVTDSSLAELTKDKTLDQIFKELTDESNCR